MKLVMMGLVLFVSGWASASQVSCKARMTKKDKSVQSAVLAIEGKTDSDGLFIGKGAMESEDLLLEVQTLEQSHDSNVESVILLVRKKIGNSLVIMGESASTSQGLDGFQSLRMTVDDKYVEIDCELK